MSASASRMVLFASRRRAAPTETLQTACDVCGLGGAWKMPYKCPRHAREALVEQAVRNVANVLSPGDSGWVLKGWNFHPWSIRVSLIQREFNRLQEAL